MCFNLRSLDVKGEATDACVEALDQSARGVAGQLRLMQEFNTVLDPIHAVLKSLKQRLEQVLLGMPCELCVDRVASARRCACLSRTTHTASGRRSDQCLRCPSNSTSKQVGLGWHGIRGQLGGHHVQDVRVHPARQFDLEQLQDGRAQAQVGGAGGWRVGALQDEEQPGQPRHVVVHLTLRQFESLADLENHQVLATPIKDALRILDNYGRSCQEIRAIMDAHIKLHRIMLETEARRAHGGGHMQHQLDKNGHGISKNVATYTLIPNALHNQMTARFDSRNESFCRYSAECRDSQRATIQDNRPQHSALAERASCWW